MATIREITIPVNFEITEQSKAVLKKLILEILAEAIKESGMYQSINQQKGQ